MKRADIVHTKGFDGFIDLHIKLRFGINISFTQLRPIACADHATPLVRDDGDALIVELGFQVVRRAKSI